MHVQNLGYTLPCNSETQKSLLRRLRNLAATLTAYIFGTKHDMHNGASALETTRGLLQEHCVRRRQRAEVVKHKIAF